MKEFILLLWKIILNKYILSNVDIYYSQEYNGSILCIFIIKLLNILMEGIIIMSKEIKVIHVITRLITGGADENTIYTVNGLAADGYNVTLVAGEESERGFIEEIDLHNEAELKILPGLVRNISPVNDLKALINIYKLLKNGNYQIIHTHTAKAGILGRLAAKLAGVPIIIHGIHGTTFPEDINPLRRFLFKFLERITGRFTDFFITVGNDLKDIYLKAGIGKPEQYQTVHSGMDLDKFYKAADYSEDMKNKIRTKYGIKEDEIVIAKVAKLQQRKGYKYYLQLVSRITATHNNVKFLIVGSGSDDVKLKKMVKAKGLEQKVIFTGYCDNVEDIFAIMDIKVLTSLWEGLPRVLVQAAATGVPIVTFAVEGAYEIVKEGENGFVVPLKDVDLLEKRVTALIEDKKLRIKMGEYGRKKADYSWSIDNMVNKIREIYKRLLMGEEEK